MVLFCSLSRVSRGCVLQISYCSMFQAMDRINGVGLVHRAGKRLTEAAEKMKVEDTEETRNELAAAMEEVAGSLLPEAVRALGIVAPEIAPAQLIEVSFVIAEKVGWFRIRLSHSSAGICRNGRCW